MGIASFADVGKGLGALALIMLFMATLSTALTVKAQDASLPTNTTKSWWENLVDTVTGFFKGIADFVNKLKELGQFIWESLTFAGKALSYAVNALTHFGDAITHLFDWFGNWGDPEAWTKLELKALSTPALGNVITKCLDPQLKDAEKPQYRLADFGLETEKHDKDVKLCDYVARVKPTGFLGYIHYGVYALTVGSKVVEFIIKYFVEIISAVCVFILVVGLEQGIKQKSVEPVINSLNLIWKVLTFPVKLVMWFVNLIIKLIQVISNFIDAIKPT